MTRIGRSAFSCCRDLASVTMCGERPDSQKNVFYICRNLKSIHVPANAKSWAGMTEWQGIPLVFDAK
ncbi:MAG: leucine-rich repeat protein [bacterium]|nr:leucine-rich repeat protein [Candidatus Colisoma equi]